MAQQVSVIVSDDDRARLEAIVRDRNHSHKHVQRARIVLLSAERLEVAEVARRAGVSRPAVWRWQHRFAEQGVSGLLRDKTRPPGTPPLPADTVARVVAMTCAEPPGEATHWTGRAMAKTTGISLRSVQRIWAEHDLQPHRLRTFKRSNDPAFAVKLREIVGLYVDPPAHSLILSVDEKLPWLPGPTSVVGPEREEIQALDRTQPGLPLKPGKAGTWTHDYKRHGTTTPRLAPGGDHGGRPGAPRAALNVLDGRVIGRCMARHRHQEFIRFLNTIERELPAGKGGFAGRLSTRHRHHPRDRSVRQRRRSRRAGLVAQQATHALLGEPALPAPHRRPTDAGLPGHRCHRQAVRRQQHDPRPLHVLLALVAVSDDRLEPSPIVIPHDHRNVLCHFHSLTRPSANVNLLSQSVHFCNGALGVKSLTEVPVTGVALLSVVGGDAAT
jgi:transposase